VIGEKGKPRNVYVQLTDGSGDKKNYSMHRLVAIAYLTKPPKDSKRIFVCHIVARRVDEIPDDGFCNLYFGTVSDNAYDAERAGVAMIGNRRYFRGWRKEASEDDFEIFYTQEDASKFIGVCLSTVSEALANFGKRIGTEQWHLEWIVMEFDRGEKLELIDGEATIKGIRFITTEGRVGEFKKVKKERNVIDVVPVEFFPSANHQSGYKYLGNVQGYRGTVFLHRLVVEKFAWEKILQKMNDTGKEWRKPHDIEVEHIDGIKANNRLANLDLKTREENNNKTNKVRAVVELDTSGENIIGEWTSVKKAADDTKICFQNIHKVCMGERKAAGFGRIFRFKKEFLNGEKPVRMLKRSRTDFETSL
jgi:hypothetical protein